MEVVTSAAIRTDSYTVAGTLYNSDSSWSVGSVGNSTPRDGNADLGLEGDGQIHGGTEPMKHENGMICGHSMAMPMNSMRQNIPRWSVSGFCDSELAHSQQLQRPRQQVQADDDLALPYQSTSSAGQNLQTHIEGSTVDGLGYHNLPSTASGGLCGSWASPNPLQNLDSAIGLPHTSSHSPFDSVVAPNMRSSRTVVRDGLAEEIKPKALASSTSKLPGRSPMQQSAATKSKQARLGKRTAHDDVERKYRTNLKNSFAQLRTAVPELRAQQENQSDKVTSPAKPQISKGTILRKATEYIEHLEQVSCTIRKENQQLVERLHALESMLQNMQIKESGILVSTTDQGQDCSSKNDGGSSSDQKPSFDMEKVSRARSDNNHEKPSPPKVGFPSGLTTPTATIGGNTDHDQSSVHSSSTETMAEGAVSAFGGEEIDSEVDSDGRSQDEGDILDDDESRSVDSDSTGSLADFIAPDWEMADGEGFLAVEDDDYDDNDDADDSGDGDDADDSGDGNDSSDDKNDRDHDRDDRRLNRACAPVTSHAPSRCSLPVSRLRDTTARVEILLRRLRRLAREFEPETDQRAMLHRHRPRYCTRRRGRRTTWVPPPLERASGSLVMASHNNAESDASPLSPNWRRRRRRARGPPVD